jgi:hypothetical protein
MVKLPGWETNKLMEWWSTGVMDFILSPFVTGHWSFVNPSGQWPMANDN